MAKFSGNKQVEGSRSHNGGLVVSGHVSPAQRWILDPKIKAADMQGVFQNGYLFDYTPGGETNEKVVIPMGRIVGVNLPVVDYTTTKLIPTLDLPGMSNNNNAIGVTPYNISRDDSQQDSLESGNYPSIITNNYIKVPMMKGIAPGTMNKAGLLDEEQRISINMKMPWGSAIGDELLREGDYVKATASGRFTKWDESTDSAHKIVGQVLATDYNFTPSGWKQWMLWDSAVLGNKTYTGDDKVINRSGSSEYPTDGETWPMDRNSYISGDQSLQQYQQEYINNPTGIPGLHDGSGNYTGYGVNDTEYENVLQDKVPTGSNNGDKMSFNIVGWVGEKITNLQAGIKIFIGGSEVPANRLEIDNLNGKVRLTLTAEDSGKDITATFKAFRYGYDSYLDFKGVNGAVYILLKF